jgi:hypothetical protein
MTPHANNTTTSTTHANSVAMRANSSTTASATRANRTQTMTTARANNTTTRKCRHTTCTNDATNGKLLTDVVLMLNKY